MMNIRVTGKQPASSPCVATIGSFDGVHQGHRHVIRQVVSQARKQGLDAMVITFPNHPRQVLHPHSPICLLTTEEEKEELLLKAGVDKVAMIEFTPELSQLTAREFMHSILKELQVKTLLIGYDNHFGHDRKSYADYVEYGKECGIEVVECEEWGEAHSSTAVREALLSGNMEKANHILGYSYSLSGIVKEGFQNGRKIGYPTANLQVEEGKLIPINGAYLAKTSQGFGMLNIGTRPTLHNGMQRSIEMHIFDFEGNLYGKELKAELLQRLREEQEFGSLDALRRQLAEDEKKCRHILAHKDSH